METIRINYSTVGASNTTSGNSAGNLITTATSGAETWGSSPGSTYSGGAYYINYPNLITYPAVQDIYNTWINLWNIQPIANKLAKEYCSSSYPAADIYEDKDNNYVFKFCVAGYKESDIEVEFEDDHMYLYLDTIEDEKKVKYLQKGIKKSESESNYYVPFDKYDVTETTADLKDGVLTITIPMKDGEKPIKIKIGK